MAFDVVNKFLDTITCINSVGNGLVVDQLTGVVLFHLNSLGGIGGSPIKSIALMYSNFHRILVVIL